MGANDAQVAAWRESTLKADFLKAADDVQRR